MLGVRGACGVLWRGVWCVVWCVLACVVACDVRGVWCVLCEGCVGDVRMLSVYGMCGVWCVVWCCVRDVCCVMYVVYIL